MALLQARRAFEAVEVSLSNKPVILLAIFWAFARSLILNAPVVATLPQQKDRPNKAIPFNA
jgi:hypothetical protein